MNVVCVYSLEEYVTVDKPIAGGDGDGIPFGIAMIATVLQHAGHHVRCLVLTPDSPLSGVLSSTIENFQPRLFCLTAVSTQFPLMKSVAKVIKTADPSAVVILGGHHATLNPEDAIACPDLDAICIGEGENAVVEFARQLESARHPSGVPNLWIRCRGAGTLEKNPTAPFLENLDGLPFICGLESGSERIRNDILRRPKYSNDGIIRFSRLARSMGIGLVFYVMIGLPDESLDDIRATIDVVRSCEPENVFLFIFYPYPGTDLYLRAKSMGLLPREVSGLSAERNRPVMGTGKVGPGRIRLEYVLFYFRAFRKRWPAVVLLTKTVRQATRTYPRLNALVNRSRLARQLRARFQLQRRSVE